MKKGLKIFFALFLLSFLVGCAYAGDENSTEIIEVQDKELIESTNTTESVLHSEKDDKLSLSSDQENIIEKSNNNSDITKKNLKIKTDSNFVKKGNNYYICLVDENGKAVFTIPGLDAGSYNILVWYSGDEKYLPAETAGSMEVHGHEDTYDIHESNLESHRTANPVIALLAVLILAGACQLRRFKK